jgi:hypothetical protein
LAMPAIRSALAMPGGESVEVMVGRGVMLRDYRAIIPIIAQMASQRLAHSAGST